MPDAADVHEVMMKGGAVFLCLMISAAPAMALDVAKLPETCRTTLKTGEKKKGKKFKRKKRKRK